MWMHLKGKPPKGHGLDPDKAKRMADDAFDS
jgi:hypothetical protein